jgi:stage IV sporulation protein FB
VHPALLVFLGYAWMTGHGLFAVLSMVSITVHEAAHAACAAAFGQPPRSIELTPLGAIMRLEDEERLSPYRRAVMVLAGPVATFILCGSAVALVKNQLLPLIMGRLLFLINISILLVNLVPVLPLDGGRLATLLLRQIFPRHTVLRLMRIAGTTLGLALVALNVYTAWRLGGWNLSLAFAGCCLIYSAHASAVTHAMAELREFMDRKIFLEQRGMLPAVLFCVMANLPVRHIVRELPRNRQGMYLVIAPGTMERLGWMTEHEIIQQYLSNPNACVKDALLCQNRDKSPKYDTN